MGVLLIVFAAIVCGIMMQKKGNYDTKEVGFLFTMLCIILCVILVTVVILGAIIIFSILFLYGKETIKQKSD